MEKLKYLQKLFFLLMMVFSLSFACVACGDDEEDEPIQDPNQEQTNNSGNVTDDGGTSPTDSIMPPAEEPVPPNDSTSGGNDGPFFPSETIIIDGHEAVDLGLPSGLKWATCNVGASSPEEYGGYYAWGETEEKRNYHFDTYKWCYASKKYYHEYCMTKYCTDSFYGTVDNKTVLDTSDDVAHVKWGGSWRIPTRDEIDELINYCTWERTTYNNVNGMIVSAPNGNCFFLPAAGYCHHMEIRKCELVGAYWSASLGGNYGSICAYEFNFSFGVCISNWARNNGYTIRPVTDKLLSDSEK